MPPTPEEVADRHGVPLYQGHPGNVATKDPLDEYRPTPEQIELSRSSVDLGDFVDELNERNPHFRAVVSVEYSYGLLARETRDLFWSRQRGRDERRVAGLDVVTIGNIPGRPEFGGLSHRLRAVVIDDEVSYGLGAMIAKLAADIGLTVTSTTVDDIPF